MIARMCSDTLASLACKRRSDSSTQHAEVIGWCGAGDFIVDDDGSGYADVGEEEDWSAEPGAGEDDQQAAKRQKTIDARKGRRQYALH